MQNSNFKTFLVRIILFIFLAEITAAGGGALKSPTHSNISKINLDESSQTSIFTSNGTRSPPRAIAVKGILDEQIANIMMSFLDNEINDMTEMEVLLSRIKQFDQMKIPFSSSNDGSTNQSSNKASKKNVLVKKKYQILSSKITIDLITSTTSTSQAMSGSERSKSRK